MATDDRSTTRAFYDRISDAYDLIAESGEHAAREAGLAKLNVHPGEQVLEVGFGTGHSLVALAKAVGSTGHVTGVDISQGMCDVAERRVNAENVNQQVELIVTAVPPLPFDDRLFDAVSMSFTLELFPLDEIPAVLAEVRRVLRPGGRLSIVSMATTREGEHDSVLERTYKWMHQHFPHFVDCQPIDAAGFVRNSGFVDVNETRLEIWTMPVAVINASRSS
ncbi:MAG: methyltransferase domain-containing protein [Rhodopirellula sp.]|nr:methyltransferase domain-containing protein [Rhodopirellula sp.]